MSQLKKGGEKPKSSPKNRNGPSSPSGARGGGANRGRDIMAPTAPIPREPVEEESGEASLDLKI